MLVRVGPLGEHQGAPRRLDGAVRQRGRDGDAGGAHPGTPGRDARCRRRGARRGPPPRRRVAPERPLPGRHPPARHHGCVAPLPRRAPRGLRCRPRPPRGRRRRGARQHAGRLHAPRPRGRRDPPDPDRAWLGDGRCGCWATSCPACAARASARRTCAHSWPPTGWRPGDSSSSPTGTDRSCSRARMAEVLDYAERRTRSAIATIPDGTYRADDVLEDDGRGSARDLAVRCSVTVAGDALTVDFAGTAPQTDGQPQLPPVRHEVGRVLRGPSADRPGHPALRGRLPPRDGDRPAGLARERARAGCRGGWQRRDLEPHRRRRDARARQGGRGAGARPGDDEQRHARQRRLHLLRDDRRRPGSVPRRCRARPRCTSR